MDTHIFDALSLSQIKWRKMLTLVLGKFTSAYTGTVYIYIHVYIYMYLSISDNVGL